MGRECSERSVKLSGSGSGMKVEERKRIGRVSSGPQIAKLYRPRTAKLLVLNQSIKGLRQPEYMIQLPELFSFSFSFSTVCTGHLNRQLYLICTHFLRSRLLCSRSLAEMVYSSHDLSDLSYFSRRLLILYVYNLTLHLPLVLFPSLSLTLSLSLISLPLSPLSPSLPLSQLFHISSPFIVYYLS